MDDSPAREARPADSISPTSADHRTTSAGPAGHIAALDGVRGMAILLVLIYHFTMGMSGSALADRLLLRVTAAGWCGVDLFFVLSGFLITKTLLDTKDSPHRFRNFYVRRALRIFPLYYGTLLVALAAFPLLGFRVHEVDELQGAWPWLWSYGTNILVAQRGRWFPLSHFWSLAVEEHFYLVWPAMIFWLNRQTALRIGAAVVLLALIARIWLVSQGAVLGAYCLTICRMDALIAGGAIALAARGGAGLRALIRPAQFAAAGSGVALLALGCWRRGFAFHDAVVQTVGYPLLDAFFASLLIAILAAPRRSLLSQFSNHPALRFLGKYSYGLYVYNSIIILILEEYAVRPELTYESGSLLPSRLVFVTLASFATLAAAWLSWHLFECKFVKWKVYFQ